MGTKYEALVEMHRQREATQEERNARYASEMQSLDDAALREAMDRGDAAHREFNRRAHHMEEIVANRIKAIDTGRRGAALFTPADLTYSAGAKCLCGAGMAYPDDIGPMGAWYCSAILTGAAAEGSQHDLPAPFMYVEIKSEYSGRGSTRPTKGGA